MEYKLVDIDEPERKDYTNESLLRFILTASISFAIGGIIAGLGIIWGSVLLGTIFEPIQYSYRGYNYEFIELIRFSVWGAIGGLGLGIATKKDKLLFILLGGLGFGAGIIVSMLFGAWSSGIGVAGTIIGVLEGMSLGLYYRNSKSIGILAICGAAGFGLGGITGTIIYKITLSAVSSIDWGELTASLITNITSFMITGLIGGAALGYGIYSMSKSYSAGG